MKALPAEPEALVAGGVGELRAAVVSLDAAGEVVEVMALLLFLSLRVVIPLPPGLLSHPGLAVAVLSAARGRPGPRVQESQRHGEGELEAEVLVPEEPPLGPDAGLDGPVVDKHELSTCVEVAYVRIWKVA